MKRWRVAAVTGACACAAVVPASAQDAFGRVSVEAVASVSITSANRQPFVILDAVSTVQLAEGWDAVVRPWARRMPAGDWAAEMYQLQLRYSSSTRVPFRVDAGIISSPIGLSTLQLRADRNPTISAPFYYFQPLPAADGRFDGKTLISGGYPLGAIVSASGAKWDARGGVTDSSPMRAANVFESERPERAVQAIAGGGVTPYPGLRIGAAVATGNYRPRHVAPDSTVSAARHATVFTVEGEFAIGHTRMQGEWISDHFQTEVVPAVARGFNVEVTRTLSPRWHAAARAVRASSPVLVGPRPGRRVASSYEATLGYRLTRALTLRGGYQGTASYNVPQRRHAAAVSIVWAQRWW